MGNVATDTICATVASNKMGLSMINWIARVAVVAFALFSLAFAAVAEPIKLKFAFFSSDRANLYHAGVKPFVDAVNTEAKGLLEIEVYFNGALGKGLVLQSQLVRDGTADIAYVTPGITPDRFRDNAVIELPGLYRNMREATLVFTRLVAANALKGYEDFFVIGAFAVEPENIHTRAPVASLDDLRGKRIRVNNSISGATLEKLGISAVVMPVNMTPEAIGSGKIDGAAVPMSPLFEFGIGRIATYHYFIQIGSAPLTVLMNRKKFDSLPKQDQDIIRKYSGEWAAERFIATYDAVNRPLMEQLKSDPKRTVVFPSQSDLDTARAAFGTVTEEWLAKAPKNSEILKAAQAQLAKLRTTR